MCMSDLCALRKPANASGTEYASRGFALGSAASFARMPFRKKLVWAAGLLAAFAVLIASAVSITSQYFSFRQETAADMRTVTQVVADNCATDLASGDASDATETLSALRNDPTVISAVLYDRDGDLFARYDREAG